MQTFQSGTALRKHKPTNFGRISLERPADGKNFSPPGFEPLASLYITIYTTNCAIWPLIFLLCNQVYISNKSENNTDHPKMKNERVEKSLEKSKNVLEEKRKMVKQKICIKNQHVYNNCYKLRSRAIKNTNWY